jgi:hypothetical protein
MVQGSTYPLAYWGGYLHFSAWFMEHLSIILIEKGQIMKQQHFVKNQLYYPACLKNA